MRLLRRDRVASRRVRSVRFAHIVGRVEGTKRDDTADDATFANDPYVGYAGEFVVEDGRLLIAYWPAPKRCSRKAAPARSAVRAMLSASFYKPRGVAVDTAATFGIPTHDRGRAKKLLREMAESDEYPVAYRNFKDAVYLEQDSESWVAAAIRRHDASELPWDLESH